MIGRQYKTRLAYLLKHFPIVCILGPRQCGKTTFVRTALPEWQYLDLERPSDLVRISQDPEDALNRLERRFILDEAQQLPELFPLLRSFVDRDRGRNGQSVLLGSASPGLIKAISESLAGRAGFLDMAPFRWHEVKGITEQVKMETLWFRGGFPDAFLKTSDRARLDWFEAYTRTFIERDLSALGIAISPPQMRKLWTMLAHVNGNLWSASKLAASMGVSYHTINRYTDILEQTFLIRKLQPWFANIGKRLVKSPKIYFRDSGLLHYFLGIHNSGTLDVHPNRGASWEAFVVDQLISAFELYSPGSQPFFWRTARGDEVDLLMVRGDDLIPFEIKLHSSPQKKDVAGLLSCMKDLQIDRGYILYPGKQQYSLGGGVVSIPAEELLGRPEQVMKFWRENRGPEDSHG